MKFHILIGFIKSTLRILPIMILVSAFGLNYSGLLVDKTSVKALQSPTVHKETITLSTILTDLSQKGRWEKLIGNALDELRKRHPEEIINVKYGEFLTNDTKRIITKAIENGTNINLVSVDQIWLGDLAEKGYLTDLTGYAQNWGRLSDWYQANLDGMIYKKKIYGIWAWTDIRGIWYWKDLLYKAGVNPDSLKTWHGYIAAATKLNSMLPNIGIKGAILHDTYYSQDLWYPYLWMLGGNILKQNSGHPTKGIYWFPEYNSTYGIEALDFIRNQINAGIAVEKFHGVSLDKEFVDRKFAVMLGGSWIPGRFPQQDWSSLSQKLGFIPMFPVPHLGNQTSTMMGGWELSIPKTSQHKDLAWELITLILNPHILGPWLERYGYLPTQIPIGQGTMLNATASKYPYYNVMISMLPFGKSRPSIPDYPSIEQDIRQALQDVYHKIKQPKQALQDSAKRSAESLGWIKH
jgi:multiple sugar transport system substrate-binding protein